MIWHLRKGRQVAQELLPLDHGAMNVRTTSEVLSDSLKAALTRASNADEAAQYIVADDALMTECRQAYPRVLKLAHGCGRHEVYVAMQPIILLWGRPDFGSGSEGENLRNAWTALFGDALYKLSRESLEHAVAEYIRKGDSRRPRPSDLYKLAEPIHLAANTLAWRMRRAIERGDAAYKPTLLSEEERAARRQEMIDLGYMTPDGKMVPLSLKGFQAPPRLAATPQKAAESLRRSAG